MATQTEQRVKFDISLSAILKVLAVVLGLIFLQKIQDILLLLFVVLILVTALSPLIDQMVRHYGIPRWLAVTFVFGGVALGVILLTWLILPLMIRQILELLALPQIKNVIGGSESSSFIDELSFASSHIPGLSGSASDFESFFFTIFGGIVYIVTVFVLTLYLLLEEDGIKKFIVALIPTNHKDRLVNTLHKISLKMGSWLRGQLLLGLIMAGLDLIVLLIFGVPYWLTLAIFGGVSELVPYIGPYLGMAAGLFIISINDSMWGLNHITAVVGVAIGYLVVQQIESHILVPKVMQRTVGLSPVIVIIAILIGAKLFGLVGVLLSVPVAAAISVIIDEWPAIQAAYTANKGEVTRALHEE